jgi:hypothetical protein
VDAFEAFGKELKGELLAALEKGGPALAVEVCSQKAPQIATTLSEQRGFTLGRSSHRLRNSQNEPSEEIRSYLKEHAEQPASQSPVEVFDEESGWLVIAPIPAQPLCLTCHGDPQTFSPELKEALGKHYPADQATGFEDGDLRGVFWARVPKAQSDKVPVSGSVPISGASSRKIKTH